MNALRKAARQLAGNTVLLRCPICETTVSVNHLDAINGRTQCYRCDPLQPHETGIPLFSYSRVQGGGTWCHRHRRPATTFHCQGCVDEVSGGAQK